MLRTGVFDAPCTDKLIGNKVLQNLGERLVRTAMAMGLPGIFLVAFADSAFVPLPQGVDALIITQAIAVPSTAYMGAALAVLGSSGGSLILYMMARRVGRTMLEKKVKANGVKKMLRQIEKYDALVLLFPTMIPVPLPMKLFVIGAGVFQMNIVRFTVVIVFARCVRYFGEAFVALSYGRQTTAFLKEHMALGVTGVIVLFIVFKFKME